MVATAVAARVETEGARVEEAKEVAAREEETVVVAMAAAMGAAAREEATAEVGWVVAETAARV